MKSLLLVGTLLLAGCAQAGDKHDVVWNPRTATLSWLGGPNGKTKYRIDYRTLTMTENGKNPLPFSKDEAVRVLMVFLNLQNYMLESEIWHEQGGPMSAPPSEKNSKTDIAKR